MRLKISPKRYAPISYFGGKSNMVKHILPLIPEHRLYVEPFCGGASIFWTKEPSYREILNDINSEVINFYRVTKTKFEELKVEIECTLSSRTQYNLARKIYKNPDNYSDVMRAWAFWVQTNMSFSNVLCGSWAFAKLHQGGSDGSNIFWKKQRFEKWLDLRLKSTQIECDDALNIIKRYDTYSTFFYIDPPYISSYRVQDYFHGYEREDFYNLLDLLSEIKGKFLLSSYPEEYLLEFKEKNNWDHQKFNKSILVNNVHPKKQKKTECLTWNYKMENV
jgi:DNA adenine methylase